MTTKNSTKRKKKLARRLVPAAILLGMLMAPAPAFAGGYCVDVYPQPDPGATVCTPWG